MGVILIPLVLVEKKLHLKCIQTHHLVLLNHN